MIGDWCLCVLIFVRVFVYLCMCALYYNANKVHVKAFTSIDKHLARDGSRLPAGEVEPQSVILSFVFNFHVPVPWYHGTMVAQSKIATISSIKFRATQAMQQTNKPVQQLSYVPRCPC